MSSDDPLVAEVMRDSARIPACEILGGIRIGEHVVVGADADVLQDAPPHDVAIGGPRPDH